MRRKDRQESDQTTMEAIIRQAQVCRLGLSDDGRPYVVPMSFGYRDRAFYFHCAHEGRKIEIMRRNPHVCIEVDIDTELVPAAEAHQFTMRFKSVIAFGTASFEDDPAEKRAALDILMAQYAEGEWAYPDKQVNRTCIFRVDVEEMTGKVSG